MFIIAFYVVYKNNNNISKKNISFVGLMMINTEFDPEDHRLISTTAIERDLKSLDVRTDPEPD
jgi:hypothetical protein